MKNNFCREEKVEKFYILFLYFSKEETHSPLPLYTPAIIRQNVITACTCGPMTRGHHNKRLITKLPTKLTKANYTD